MFYLLIQLSFNLSYVECEAINGGPFTARIAKYLIDYFHLEEFDILPENENKREGGSYNYDGYKHENNYENHSSYANYSNYNRCDSIRSMEDYFFQVYASTENNFTLEDLDDLIHFHVKKVRKVYNQNKHRKYSCNRKLVIILI